MSRKIKKPRFRRQDWMKKKRLGVKWRRPKGRHSALREHQKSTGARPQPGYGSPKATRGLNALGMKEVRIFTLKELGNIDPKKHMVVLASGIGKKKRLEIADAAEKKGIKIANLRYVKLISRKKG